MFLPCQAAAVLYMVYLIPYIHTFHTALQPLEVYEFFSRVCSHANDLNHAYSKAAKGNMRVPLITVC